MTVNTYIFIQFIYKNAQHDIMEDLKSYFTLVVRDGAISGQCAYSYVNGEAIFKEWGADV